MKELYPEIETYNTDFLKVSDIHQIYFEESGNPGKKKRKLLEIVRTPLHLSLFYLPISNAIAHVFPQKLNFCSCCLKRLGNLLMLV